MSDIVHPSNRIMKSAVVLLITAIGVFYFLTIREGHDWGDDFSLYIHHAINIAQGNDYKAVGYVPPDRFDATPPIFPLLLSLIYIWFGLSLTVMKLAVILSFIAFLFVFYLAIRDEVAPHYAAIIIAMIGFNPFLWDFRDQILSDMPFLLFIFSTLFLIHKAYLPGQTQRARFIYAILVGLFLYLSYGTRSIGIILIPSLLLYELIRARRLTRFVVVAISIFGLLVLLQMFILHKESSGNYIGAFLSQFTFHVVLSNISSYMKFLGVVLGSGDRTLFTTILIGITVGMVFAGYLHRIKSGITIYELFFPIYTTTIIAWPAEIVPRYLIPIIPLFIFYAFLPIGRIAIIRHPLNRMAILILLTAAIMTSYIAYYMKADFGPMRDGISKKETVELFDYIRLNTNESDVFIFWKPRALSLFTGRRASHYIGIIGFRYPYQVGEDKPLWDWIHEIRATHVISSYGDPDYYRAFINKNSARFLPMFSNADFTIFMIKE